MESLQGLIKSIFQVHETACLMQGYEKIPKHLDGIFHIYLGGSWLWALVPEGSGVKSQLQHCLSAWDNGLAYLLLSFLIYKI